jgi:uncharacterized membrane protein YesL
VLENVGISYCRLVYFISIWYTLWSFGVLFCHLVCMGPFGIFFPVLVHFTKKNLATLSFSLGFSYSNGSTVRLQLHLLSLQVLSPTSVKTENS